MNLANLEARYAETVGSMAATGLCSAGELPTLQSLMKAIKDTVGDETLSFDEFEQFFNWWDVTTAYDQMDEEVSAESHKPALELAFIALVQEGFFVIDFKADYDAKLAALLQSGAIIQGDLADFDSMIAEIKFAVSMEQIRFWDFNDFFSFWEQAVAVAAQNMSLSLANQRPALETLYNALRTEGFL